VFVSVVIPAYNEEKYIGACLEALHQQTYPHNQFEIIVVNNRCTDQTAAIARRMGALVVYEGFKGIGAARQRGALAARGEIIAGTDADTIVPPDWLERIAARFAAEPDLGGLYGPIRHHDGSRLAKRYIETVMPLLMRLAHRAGKPCFSGNNFAVRKDKLMQVGGFNPALLTAEDVDVSMRLCAITRIAFDPTFIAYTSSRRAQEGVTRILIRTFASGLRMLFLGQSPLAPPDIR
jgi:glycosyltransferase involved in cell wall biosynthesis